VILLYSCRNVNVTNSTVKLSFTFIISYRIKIGIRRHRWAHSQRPTSGYAHEPTSTKTNYVVEIHCILSERAKVPNNHPGYVI